MLTATVKSKAGVAWMEVLRPDVESSLERAHILGPQAAGHDELQLAAASTAHVHGDEGVARGPGG